MTFRERKAGQFRGEAKNSPKRAWLRSARACTLATITAVALFHVMGTLAADSSEQEVEEILGRMTLAEKFDYIGGIKAMSIRPIPRLGLPEIRMSDGPLGVRQDRPSTRYPAGIALAATWNRVLPEKEGSAMARDCRVRGISVLLAPGMNINRVPFCGRNFEYLSGEDPYLAAQMVVPFIRGVQGRALSPLQNIS